MGSAGKLARMPACHPARFQHLRRDAFVSLSPTTVWAGTKRRNVADITHRGHRLADDDTNALTGGSRLLITSGPALARHHWADTGWGRSTKTVITRRQWWRGGHSNFQAKRWPRFLPQSSLGPFWPSSFAKSADLRSDLPLRAHEVSFLFRFLSSGRFVHRLFNMSALKMCLEWKGCEAGSCFICGLQRLGRFSGVHQRNWGIDCWKRSVWFFPPWQEEINLFFYRRWICMLA
jgi:hypothetical protein